MSDQSNSDSKSWYASKTFWVAAVLAVTPAVTATFPVAGVWLAANSDWVCTGIAAAFGALRLVTNKPVG